jgi:hypothetical protein
MAIGVCVVILGNFVERLRGVPLGSGVCRVVGCAVGAKATGCPEDAGKGAVAVRSAGVTANAGTSSSSSNSSLFVRSMAPFLQSLGMLVAVVKCLKINFNASYQGKKNVKGRKSTETAILPQRHHGLERLTRPFGREP